MGNASSAPEAEARVSEAFKEAEAEALRCNERKTVSLNFVARSVDLWRETDFAARQVTFEKYGSRDSVSEYFRLSRRSLVLVERLEAFCGAVNRAAVFTRAAVEGALEHTGSSEDLRRKLLHGQELLNGASASLLQAEATALLIDYEKLIVKLLAHREELGLQKSAAKSKIQGGVLLTAVGAGWLVCSLCGLLGIPVGPKIVDVAFSSALVGMGLSSVAGGLKVAINTSLESFQTFQLVRRVQREMELLEKTEASAKLLTEELANLQSDLNTVKQTMLDAALVMGDMHYLGDKELEGPLRAVLSDIVKLSAAATELKNSTKKFKESVLKGREAIIRKEKEALYRNRSCNIL